MTDLVVRLRERADRIVDNDCAVIESGGKPGPWPAENERLMREAADEIDRLRRLQVAFEKLLLVREVEL